MPNITVICKPKPSERSLVFDAFEKACRDNGFTNLHGDFKYNEEKDEHFWYVHINVNLEYLEELSEFLLSQTDLLEDVEDALFVV